MKQSYFAGLPLLIGMPIGGRRLGSSALAGLLTLSFSAHAQLLVQSATPAPNAVAAPRPSNVALTYNQPVDASSATNVRVFSPQVGGRKAATASASGNTLTVDPTQDFKPGETVFVTAPATVLGMGGAAATPYVYQFTTQAGVGPGTFDNSIFEVGTNNASGGVVATDIDNDGDLDLVATTANASIRPREYALNYVSYAATVRLNDGKGNFSGSTAIVSSAYDVNKIATGDLDGDGKMDIVLAGANPLAGYRYRQAYLLSIHLGSNTFVGDVTQDYPVTSIALGDLDGDGDLDMLTTNSNGVVLRFNSGTGSFNTGTGVAFAGKASDVAVADVDGDGDLDLLVSQGSTVSVRLNNGQGVFSGGTDSGAAGNLATADVDGDGDLDLLVAIAASNTVSVRLNDGTGTFSAGTAVPVGSNPSDVAASDVDGDGDLDLLTTNQASNTVSVRLNNGTGNFSGTMEVAVGGSPAGLAVGDVDGDLDLDLLTANTTGRTVSVRLNQAASPTPRLISVSTAPRTGNTVTLTGTNLTGATAVTFNGVAAPSFTVDSPTQITATLPVNVTTGLVTITTPQGPTNGVQFDARPLVLPSSIASTANNVSYDNPFVYVAYNQVINDNTFGIRAFSQQTAKSASPLDPNSLGSSTSKLFSLSGFKPGETAFITVLNTVQGSNGLPAVPYVCQLTARVSTGVGTFNGGSEVALVSATGKSVTADIDNDGDLDLLAANQNNTVSVRRNDGKGTFGAAGADVPVGNSPTSLIVGDIDYDGDLDLLTANSDGTVSVRLNLGNGAISPTGVEVPVGNSPTSLTLADIDGDGDLDLLTTSPTGNNTVSVRFNDGQGKFSGSQQVPVGANPYDVAAADIDSDGDLDLLTANSSGTVSVRLNNSLGTFGAGSEVSVGQNPRSLLLNDVDKDGDLDVVTANYDSNTVSVRLNDGKGIFSGGSEVTVGTSPVDVAFADVDADRDLDLLTANQGSNTVSVRLNDGKGTYSGSQEVAVGTSPLSIAIGNLDGGYDVDLLTGNQGSNSVSVRFNQKLVLPSLSGISAVEGGKVTLIGANLLDTKTVTFNGVAAPAFTVVSATQLNVTLPANVASGPVNVTTPSGTSNAIQFIAPAASPSVTSVQPVRNAVAAPRSTPVSVTFDNALTNSAATQGSLRVFGQQSGGRKAGAVSVSGNTLTLTPATPFKPGETVFATVTKAAEGSGSTLASPQVFQFTTATAAAPGTFAPPAVAANGTLPVDVSRQPTVVVGDVDSDGDLDVLATSYYGNAVSVRLNNGAGVFMAPATGGSVAVGSNPRDLALGDVDGDGDLDLVTANYEYSASIGTVSVRLNNGAGVFAAPTTGGSVPVSGPANSVLLTDLDGDGDLDIAVVNNNGNGNTGTINVRFNNGAGIFTAPATGGTIPVGSSPYRIASGDVDGDGDLDLLTANSFSGDISLRLNNGAGVFTVPASGGTISVGPLYSPQDIKVGDVDGDGDLDLVTGSYGASSVLFNNGAGLFTLSSNPVVPLDNITDSIALGDVDGDGDLDLVATIYTYNTVNVRYNNGKGLFTVPGVVAVGTVSVGSVPRSVVLGDVDGDGDLDILTANENDNTVSVRLNQPISTTPTLSSISAPVRDNVTLTGTNLKGTTGVTFNGVAITTFTVVSDTQITVQLPLTVSSGPVVVTAPNGTSNAIQFNAPPTAPLIVGLTPARNAVAAPRTTPVSVTFTQPLKASVATLSSLRVFSRQAGGRKAGVVSVSGNTLTLTPTTPFQPGETVFASVNTSLESTSNTLTYPHVFQFTAATAPASGVFLEPTMVASGTVPVGSGLSDVVLADMNGDGDLDLLTQTNGPLSLRLNDGAGNFITPANSSMLQGSSNDITLGDVDGDGDLDVVTLAATSGRGGTMTARLNNGAGVFTSSKVSDATSAAVHLNLGDVDGDGDLDIISTGFNGGSIHLNDGTGNFRLFSGVNIGYNRVVLGDIDNDGDLDLLAATSSFNGNTVEVRLNNGTGVFTAPAVVANGSVLVGSAPSYVVLGDIDGDGDLDLLTANSNDNTVSVRLNNGAGVFTTPATGTLAVGKGPSNLALGDADGDGDLDLFVSNQGDNTVSVRLNNGAGVFTTPATGTVAVGSGPAKLDLGDVDGDGDLDVVTANYTSGNVSVRLNQGGIAPSLTPTLASISTPTGTSFNTVTLTGTNLTGATEVVFNGAVVGKYQFTGVAATELTVILPSTVKSGPVTVTTPYGISNTIQFVAPPIITSVQPVRNAPAASRATPVSVTFNQPLSNSATTLSGLQVFSQQAGGRKNGAVTVNSNTLSLTPTTPFKAGETVYATVTKNVQSADGASLIVPQVFQFTAATAPAAGLYSVGSVVSVGAGPSSPVLGDVDGDGDLDLLVATTSGTVSVRQNAGGSYAGSQEVALDGVARQLVLGDVDGDSDLDVVAVLQSGVVRLLRNQGNGTFTSAAFPATDSGQGVALGDVDADGDLDVVLTKPTLGLVNVFTNDGTGTFMGGSTSGVVKGIGATPVLADTDGDGDLDLLVTDNSNRQARIYVNIGGAFFGSQTVAAGGGGFVDALTVGDIDKDGDLDLLTASYTSSRISVRRNNGQGAFSGTQEVDLQSRGPVTLALGDVDGDGDLDLLTTNQNTRTISVRLNDGTGGFSGSQEVTMNQLAPNGLALGDVDGDGDLDIVTPHAASNQVSVLLNQNALASTTAQASRLAEGGAMARTSVLQLSPNPSSGRLVVHYDAKQAQAATLVVSDRLGRTVQQQTLQLQAGENEVALDLSGQAQGMYQVLLRPAHDQPQAQKLVLAP
jgi:methionine-rich copper-binding protein CopC